MMIVGNKSDFVQASIVAAVFTAFVSLCDRRKASCDKFKLRRRQDKQDNEGEEDQDQSPPFMVTKWAWVWYIVVFLITGLITLFMLGAIKSSWKWKARDSLPAPPVDALWGMKEGARDGMSGISEIAQKTGAVGGDDSSPVAKPDISSLLDVLSKFAVGKDTIDQVMAHMDRGDVDF